MGITKHYFDFHCQLGCGPPSVTLLGEKSVWQQIYDRLGKLENYGTEPTHFCNLLKPVLSRFVNSFDDPCGDDSIKIWQQIAHYKRGGSGSSCYSGWITAFCFWKPWGQLLCHILDPVKTIEKISSNPSKIRGKLRYSAKS